MSRPRFLIAALCIGAALIAIFFLVRAQPASQTNSQPSSSRLVKVVADEVRFASNARIFEATGSVSAVRSAELYPKVDERVTRVLFKAQDKVKKGQLLVQQDDRQQQLALRLAKVQMENTKSLLERYQQAVAKGAVPQSQVDSAQAEFDAARLAVEQAELDIELRQVRAPFDGVVGISKVDPGQRIAPGVLITGVDDRRVMYIDFEVPEALVPTLKSASEGGVSLRARTVAVANRTYEAKVTEIDNRLDPLKRTLLVRAEIDNQDDLIRPGMSFVMTLDVPGEQLPTVPELALQWDRQGAYVWKLEDSVARRIDLQVIERRDGQVFVSGELRNGDVVVVEGGRRVSNGERVQIVEATAP